LYQLNSVFCQRGPFSFQLKDQLVKSLKIFGARASEEEIIHKIDTDDLTSFSQGRLQYSQKTKSDHFRTLKDVNEMKIKKRQKKLHIFLSQWFAVCNNGNKALLVLYSAGKLNSDEKRREWSEVTGRHKEILRHAKLAVLTLPDYYST
jgi:hypothetical protein